MRTSRGSPESQKLDRYLPPYWLELLSEIARQIGRTGVTVLLGARKKAVGEGAAATLTAEGIAAHFIAIDVTDHASVEAAATTVTAGFGRLDILVNNAGINDPDDGPAPTAALEAVERVLRTNLLGALAVTQAMLPLCTDPRLPASSMCPAALALLPRTVTRLTRAPPTKLIGYSASKALSTC